MGYRLSNCAVDDLIALWMEGARVFGLEQAEKYHAGLEACFAFLADNPRAARLRAEINPPVRAHPFKMHLVLYEKDGAGGIIIILRIRHGREDWVSDPLASQR